MQKMMRFLLYTTSPPPNTFSLKIFDEAGRLVWKVIAKELDVTLAQLFKADSIFTNVNSADKTLMEKIKVIEQLEEQERNSLYNIIDGLFSKKKLKDTLSSALAQ